MEEFYFFRSFWYGTLEAELWKLDIGASKAIFSDIIRIVKKLRKSSEIERSLLDPVNFPEI